MKKLLIVTDHRFYQFENEIYDKYVFGYDFFQDYLKVFDKIAVIARCEKQSIFPDGYLKTTGENLKFISVGDKRGLSWFLSSSDCLKRAGFDLKEYTAVCVRIPSALSYSVFRKVRKHNMPLMFEFIGDPKAALVSQNDSFIKRVALSLIGDIMKIRMKKIVKYATCGSYVSFEHLQKNFPAKEAAPTDTISSIRLESNYILNDLKPIDLDTFKIVHVGSFVPIKNQEFLINLFSLLCKNNFKAELTLIGDGPLLPPLKDKVNKLGFLNKIKFEGHVIGIEKIISKIDEHNIFILPSFSEGMPRALIEAMSRGLLCFGANRGGIRELLEEEYLFDPSDTEDLLSKIKFATHNTTAIAANRNRNLKKASFFEKSNLSERRQKLLKKLINNGQV